MTNQLFIISLSFTKKSCFDTLHTIACENQSTIFLERNEEDFDKPL